ncbi:MAG: suppressor of fused domain protein [Defluviitaleaceae bacterium]|nr:suppressor of fused domain protein [Defluviitaleaceae bacterium]MCL2264172.1 suppressor of fused domain protein [Defluviitaleaceae bacterium]
MGIFGFGKKKSECILSSTSPLTDIIAQVVVENDCSYLYLQADTSDGKAMMPCWIKNHITVNEDYSAQSDMKRGLQPKVPTKYCECQSDLSPLKAEQLEIAWGKEGAIVSLYEGDELICVIPYWTDQNFCGYSKYSCTDKFPNIPFPLGNSDSNALFKRAELAREFWKQDFSLLWGNYQESYLSELESKYGKEIKYYAIDGGNFPPKALAVFEKDSMKYVFTIGVGLFPQPKVDMHFEDYQNHECFELGFCYPSSMVFDESSVFSQISSITTIPWSSCTFLSHRHTVSLQVDTQYNNAVLVSDKDIDVAQSKFLREQNINLLWLVPISHKTYANLIADPSDYSEVETKITNKDIVFRGKL